MIHELCDVSMACQGTRAADASYDEPGAGAAAGAAGAGAAAAAEPDEAVLPPPSPCTKLMLYEPEFGSC